MFCAVSISDFLGLPFTHPETALLCPWNYISVCNRIELNLAMLEAIEHGLRGFSKAGSLGYTEVPYRSKCYGDISHLLSGS